jgi:hypothetical protein
MSSRRVLVAFSLAALVALPAAASAAVATTLGGAASSGNHVSCDQDGAHPTLIQSARPVGGVDYTVRSAGVVTSFTTYQDGSSARGLVLRPNGVADQYTLVGKSAVAAAVGQQTLTLPTRIPVLTGDVIALQALTAAGTKTQCASAGISGYNTLAVPASSFDPDTAGPGTVADFSGGAAELQQLVNLSAQLEADADGDGYGDVTQDLCPTSAATQAACPAGTTPPGTTPPGTNPPGTTAKAPETTLVGTVKKKVTKRVITLAFTSPTAGATYRCQVDKSASQPCTSPYKHRYKLGKHTVTIAAVDPATGLADTTPLVVKFKVKPKR